jgi:hypothetical protein
MKKEEGYMHQIYPVSREICTPYVGHHVCAVLQDGTQMHGVISNVTDRGLEFNGAVPGAEILSKNPQKAKKQLQHLQQKGQSNLKSNAKTSAYGPYGAPYGRPYGGYPGAYGLDWAAIALLFLIPFLFI